MYTTIFKNSLTLRLYETVPVYSGQSLHGILSSSLTNNFELKSTHAFTYSSTMMLHSCYPGFIYKCLNFKNGKKFQEKNQLTLANEGQQVSDSLFLSFFSLCLFVIQSLSTERFYLSRVI